MQKEIIGIGAANVTIAGRSNGRFAIEEHNTGSLTLSAGGTACNFCRNAARLGLPTRLIAVVGEDAYGAELARVCAADGVTADLIPLAERSTAATVQLCRSGGETAVTFSDNHIQQQLVSSRLQPWEDKLMSAAAVVVDGSLPQETLRYIVRICGEEVPVFADPGTVGGARRMRPLLQGMHTVKPNRQEAEALSGRSIRGEADYFRAAEIILGQGVQRVVITGGAKGCFYADAIGQRYWGQSKPFSPIESAIGAGESVMAALVYSHLQGASLPDTMELMLGAGLMALQTAEAVNPELSVEEMRRLAREYRR